MTHQDRKVPWTGLDVLFLFLLYGVLMAVSVDTALRQVGQRQDRGGMVQGGADQEKPQEKAATTDHPLSQLLRQGKESPSVLLLVFLCGVVITPLTEEFLFRLILQSWMVKLALSIRERLAFLSSPLLPGVFSVTTTSLIFALAHGGKRVEQSAEYLFSVLLGVAVGNSLTLLFGLVYLVVFRKAGIDDLGLRTNRLANDLFYAAALFLTVIPLILVAHAELQRRFPGIVTDPVPLFFFSLVLGALFYRTGRLIPCILLHGMLNGFSFLALALARG